MGQISYAVEDAVATITLDAPPINALTLPLLDELLAALARAREDAGVRALVLASALPRFFSAGLDLDALREESGDGVVALLDRLYLKLWDVQHGLAKPSIAAVSGAARGGGMTMAISCNVIVAGEGATFGYPEIDVGLIPAIHFVHLPRIIGRLRAFELLFTGRAFDAREAQALGLASRVVADDQVLNEAHTLARIFAAKSPTAMKLGHAAFMHANDVRADIGEVVEPFRQAAISENGREGVRAFVEKRKPAWK